MIEKQELADGIRFAGRRAAAALEHVPDFDRQLAQEWTTADAFRHIAAGAGALAGFYGVLGTDALESFSNDDAASGNARTIEGMAEVSREELGVMIVEGSETSASFVETLDDDDLATRGHPRRLLHAQGRARRPDLDSPSNPPRLRGEPALAAVACHGSGSEHAVQIDSRETRP